MALTPPPGKTWITVEVDTTSWDTGNFEYEDAFDNVIEEKDGPAPETDREKGVRRLNEARRRFEDARFDFRPGGSPHDAAQAMRDGCSLLVEALTLLGEDL